MRQKQVGQPSGNHARFAQVAVLASGLAIASCAAQPKPVAPPPQSVCVAKHEERKPPTPAVPTCHQPLHRYDSGVASVSGIEGKTVVCENDSILKVRFGKDNSSYGYKVSKVDEKGINLTLKMEMGESEASGNFRLEYGKLVILAMAELVKAERGPEPGMAYVELISAESKTARAGDTVPLYTMVDPTGVSNPISYSISIVDVYKNGVTASEILDFNLGRQASQPVLIKYGQRSVKDTLRPTVTFHRGWEPGTVTVVISKN